MNFLAYFFVFSWIFLNSTYFSALPDTDSQHAITPIRSIQRSRSNSLAYLDQISDSNKPAHSKVLTVKYDNLITVSRGYATASKLAILLDYFFFLQSRTKNRSFFGLVVTTTPSRFSKQKEEIFAEAKSCLSLLTPSLAIFLYSPLNFGGYLKSLLEPNEAEDYLEKESAGFCNDGGLLVTKLTRVDSLLCHYDEKKIVSMFLQTIPRPDNGFEVISINREIYLRAFLCSKFFPDNHWSLFSSSFKDLSEQAQCSRSFFFKLTTKKQQDFGLLRCAIACTITAYVIKMICSSRLKKPSYLLDSTFYFIKEQIE